MNGTLEAMAQALFKAWFVDFDPVVAKREGRKPVGMDDATAALFPERFQDTAMGPVPAGWKQGRIGDVLALSRASINPSDYPDETFSHYSIPAFDSGATPIKELGASIKSNKYRIPDICVLISKLNPETPRVWTPSGPFEHLAICSTEFFVTVPRQPFSTAYVFSLLGSKEFTEEFATFVTGTSNSHQRVKPDDFLNMLAVSPRREIVEAFDQRVAILLNRVQRARKQSSSLASLREALLPKLLSGDLTVGQTEKIVEES
jgi:type I restriction enzyme S subunit